MKPIHEIIKDAEDRIDALRKRKNFKEADEERDWWLSVGFEIKQTKTITKIIYKGKK